jgi:hypothetical protein
MNFDIWFEIFLFLTLREQAKISATCRIFREAYKKHILLNTLNPEKYIFYQYAGQKKYNIFSIETILKFKRGKITEYVKFKEPSVRRKILYDRERTPYCRDPIKKNGFVFSCKIKDIKDLSKVHCDICKKFTICELDYSNTQKCKVKKCSSNYFHFHNSCKNCYNKINALGLSENSFKEPEFIYI